MELEGFLVGEKFHREEAGVRKEWARQGNYRPQTMSRGFVGWSRLTTPKGPTMSWCGPYQSDFGEKEN